MQTNVENDGRATARRLFAYVKPYWLMFSLGILSTMLFAAIDASATYMLESFINLGFVKRDPTFIQIVPFAILIAFAVRGLMNFFSVYCMAWVGHTIVRDFRQQIFARFQTLPANYYDSSSSGKLLSKLLFDVQQVTEASTDAVTTFVQSLCFVLGLIIVMFGISWKLSLLFFVTTPIIVWIVQKTNRRTRRFSQAVQTTMGRVTEIAEENIQSYRDVRVFNAEQHEINKFNQTSNDVRRGEVKVAMARAYSVSGVQIVAAFNIGIIIYFAINPQFSTFLSAGAFSAMVVSMFALLKPMKDLSRMNAKIQTGLTGARSIFALFDAEKEKDNGTQCLSDVKGKITFNHVTFSYQEENVLKNIELTIQPGETVALVGRSGSGKSTIVSLIPRFYDVNEGAILIDNVDIRTIQLTELRKQIALVSQQVNIFNGTVRDNIAFGLLDVSEEAIRDAARKAHALEFIDQLPQGLDTEVGDNGTLLSGGQRQRVAIARAILKNAPILILDEATSALDSDAEKHIQAALETVMENRTTIVVAHRLSTIEKADKIIVLENGRIVEQGTHQSLLEKGEYYANFHALQFKQEVAEETVL